MSHFSPKSLAFYAIAIGSVAVLFKVVTAYGETNLKAPAAIAGTYRFDANNLPGCLKSDSLVLIIEQSGVYLSGNLRSSNTNQQQATTAKDKPTLAGRFETQGLSLSGLVPNLTGCTGETTTAQNSFVKLRGNVEGETLKGKISLTENAPSTDFTAQREAQVKQQKNTH